jgi:DNA-binding NarL/FixJ family response regulator
MTLIDEHSGLNHIRVLLVDSTDLVHWGFRSVLRRELWVDELVGARTAGEALHLAHRCRPHVAVVDSELRGEAASEICEGLPQLSPATRILLTARRRVPEARAKELGAGGVVPRTWDGRDIAEAARLVALGEDFFPPDSDRLAELLSPREQTVLEMLVGGATNREIAAELHLSYNTVKDHVSGVYRKLNARNRPDAVLRAHRLGLLD